MSNSETALLVVDVQASFRQRPYWCDSDVPFFLQSLRSLINGAQSKEIPVVQIFHVEDRGPFSPESGYVVPMQELFFVPDDPAFGFYRPLFAGKVCMLEEKDPSPKGKSSCVAQRPVAAS